MPFTPLMLFIFMDTSMPYPYSCIVELPNVTSCYVVSYIFHCLYFEMCYYHGESSIGLGSRTSNKKWKYSNNYYHSPVPKINSQPRNRIIDFSDKPYCNLNKMSKMKNITFYIFRCFCCLQFSFTVWNLYIYWKW